MKFFIGMFAFIVVILSISEYNEQEEKNNWTVLNIQGKEKIEVEPDTATFTITIEDRDGTEESVRSSVKLKTEKVLSTLKNNGVSTDEIETTYLNSGSQPQYVENEEKNQNDAFLQNSIQIKTKSIDGIEQIFNEVSVIKGVNFAGLYYEVDDMEKMQDDLAAVATGNAREKAEKITNSLKTDIKGIKSIQTEHNNFGIYPAFATKEIQTLDSSAPIMQNPENNNVPIFKKKIEIQSIVYVEFFVY